MVVRIDVPGNFHQQAGQSLAINPGIVRSWSLR
jgi:hypothetical protein